MQWLEQNWLFVLLGAGVIFFMMRSGGMGCGMGGSMGGGMRRGQGGSADGASSHDHGQAPMPAQAIDPVSGRPVDPSTAISTVYRGLPVYFESRENRDRFEAAPGQFALTQAQMPQSHRHGGC
ncbi:MAG: hypothetical protein KGJ64_00825 [Betaproteobacteria bacterium]|nr:hypothetical protein [Betaproteobacteria bacterium]